MPESSDTLTHARHASARDYHLLFEVLPLPAWVYDVETLRFLAVNPAAISQYGYTEEQFLGMTILDIRPEEDEERVREQVRVRNEGFEGQMRGWGHRHRYADGTLIDVDIISHSFVFEGRSARIVVVNDVTEQRRMRLREREMEAQLIQAQKMEAIGRLAGGVAHDFNNLLSVVLNAATAIEEELPSGSRLHEDVGDIRHAVERGATLTRQLLTVGRKEVHAPAMVDVRDVVRTVERLLVRVLGGQVRLDIRCGDEPALALADASQLEQVLINLAINARDAMPRGGLLTIATSIVKLPVERAQALGITPGAYVAVEVGDTGSGMDQETLARAFEPFFTTKGPHEGTGLGLSTVYGIVRQSNGAVTIDSTPGSGTHVTVMLPQGEARSETADLAEETHPDPSRDPVTVLLVDDEPRVLAQAHRMLERCGFRVIDAKDGIEGERLFVERRGDVSVVVTDVMMPSMSGVDMVAHLRALAPEVPVVFVSGYTAGVRDLPLDAQTVFVAKPYTLAMLCNAIAAVVPS